MRMNQDERRFDFHGFELALKKPEKRRFQNKSLCFFALFSGLPLSGKQCLRGHKDPDTACIPYSERRKARNKNTIPPLGVGIKKRTMSYWHLYLECAVFYFIFHVKNLLICFSNAFAKPSF